MISLALVLMTGVECARDGYIAQPHNCVYPCIPLSPGCDNLCKENGATSGKCSFLLESGLACWCVALPDNVPIKIEGQKCTR
uniref:Alpha-neurotoxin 10 n=1 Tax=Androctonus mauritanicus mauritanicus TaxID=6860 RepID=D5HR54_ANDMA|nr:alpha-neurotoxin 10 precursor [Androctonus mauritanicus mauritanicus]